MDAILEFHDDLTLWLEKQLSGQRSRLLWNGCDIYRAVFNFLWYSNLKERDSYIRFRESKDGKKYFDNISIQLPTDRCDHDNYVIQDLHGHPWRNILEKEAGKTLIYADNDRHIKYLKPLLSDIGTPAILLTLSKDIPDYILSKANIRILTLNFFKTPAISTSGLCTIRPLLASYVHTLYCYIHWLKPVKLICCDGCQTQYQLAAIFCKNISAQSECYQFGWPGYIHAGFGNLPYDTIYTWGDIYSRIWSRKNPHVKFATKGRLGHCNAEGPHDCITFFLQAPVFVSSNENLSLFLDAILATIERFPRTTVLVRPHPEAGIDRGIARFLERPPDIELSKEPDVEDVYRRTSIAISQYSSCLVESELFGCRAICFNPIRDFDYKALPASQRVYDCNGLIGKLEKFLSLK